jgi:hypothetical protein
MQGAASVAAPFCSSSALQFVHDALPACMMTLPLCLVGESGVHECDAGAIVDGVEGDGDAGFFAVGRG